MKYTFGLRCGRSVYVCHVVILASRRMLYVLVWIDGLLDVLLPWTMVAAVLSFSRCFARFCAAAPKLLHSSRPLVKYPVLRGPCQRRAWWQSMPRGDWWGHCGVLWSPMPSQLSSPRVSMASEPIGSQYKRRGRARGHVSGRPLSCRRCPVLPHARPLPVLAKLASEPTSDTATATPIHTCKGPLQVQSASAAQATPPAARGVPSEGSPSGCLFPQRASMQGTPRPQVPLSSTASPQAQPGIASADTPVLGGIRASSFFGRVGACVAPRLCGFSCSCCYYG